ARRRAGRPRSRSNRDRGGIRDALSRPRANRADELRRAPDRRVVRHLGSDPEPDDRADAAARAAGLPPEKIRVHTTYLGGGFGRRTVPDFVTQAVEIAKATGQPIRLAWTRDE